MTTVVIATAVAVSGDVAAGATVITVVPAAVLVFYSVTAFTLVKSRKGQGTADSGNLLV